MNFNMTSQSQAHWLVALADPRPKSARELAYATRALKEIKRETLTHNIKQLGFYRLREFGSRFSNLVSGQVSSPKTLPFQIVER